MVGISYQQFSSIVPFILIFFMGFICGKTKIMDGTALKNVSSITMNVLSSFVVINLLQVPKSSDTSSELMWGIITAITIFAFFVLVAYLFFLRNKKETSGVYSSALCSSAVITLAYPLLKNISADKAHIYTAAFLIVNQLLFSIFSAKVLYKKRNLIKSIINLPFIMSAIGLILYFTNCQLILPIANTVSSISGMVPTLSALLIGMYFSTFPLKGIKFQFDIVIVSVFKLFLLPLLTLGICLILKLSLESTLLFVTLAGLPCGYELSSETSRTQKKNLPYAANLSGFSFVLSVVSIPVVCYIASQIHMMIY